jgi:hypothetical protein
MMKLKESLSLLPSNLPQKKPEKKANQNLQQLTPTPTESIELFLTGMQATTE